MIDLNYIRENINEVKKSTKQKGCDVDFDSIIILDDKRRELIIKVEKLKAERNKINQEISYLIKNKMDASSIIINMKAISEKIKTLDEDLGIINKVATDDELQATANEIIDQIANGPSTALRYMKHNMNLAEEGNLNASLDSEALYQTLCRDTEDHQNAAKSFVAKQKPVFTGR